MLAYLLFPQFRRLYEEPGGTFRLLFLRLSISVTAIQVATLVGLYLAAANLERKRAQTQGLIYVVNLLGALACFVSTYTLWREGWTVFAMFSALMGLALIVIVTSMFYIFKRFCAARLELCPCHERCDQWRDCLS